MIEDKNIGLKIAENSDEAFWRKQEEDVAQAIVNMKRNIEISEVVLDLCKKHTAKYPVISHSNPVVP